MECDLYNNVRDINVCTDFEMLKVKVPIIFLGTEGFSPRKDVCSKTRPKLFCLLPLIALAHIETNLVFSFICK